MGDTRIPRPTKPWRNDSKPYTGAGVGNIQDYSVGATLEIRNTETNYEMQWIEVNDGGKKYLICDRVMLVNISWDDLNAQGLIFGKNVTIDGQQYKLRVLTGGSNDRSINGYSGGTPTTNEWDRWIVNEAGLSGLPTPTASDLDTIRNSDDLNSPHNQKWNWYYVFSWVQDTYTKNSDSRALRGYSSARAWSWSYKGSYSAHLGWRPVLEVLNSAPVTSGSDSNLGNKSSANFEWDTPKTSGGNFNITATEWNRFLNAINSARVGKGLTAYNFTYASKGGDFYAYMFNQAVQAISAMNPPVPPPSTRSSGDEIYASYFTQLKNSLNSIQ